MDNIQMNDKKLVVIPENPRVDTTPDLITLVLGFLGAIKLILAAPPFKIEIANETLDAWANIIALAFTAYGIWKNSYVSKTAQQQKSVLLQTGLKK